MAELLIREEAEPQGITPGGKQLKIVYEPDGTNMYLIQYTEGGTLPDRTASSGASLCAGDRFTKPALAEKALRAYVKDLWDMSELQAKKNTKKRQVAKQNAKAEAERPSV
jgi:hypothetical protein